MFLKRRLYKLSIDVFSLLLTLRTIIKVKFEAFNASITHPMDHLPVRSPPEEEREATKVRGGAATS